MRKKLLAVMLSFTLAAGLVAGCGKSSSGSSSSEASSSADSGGSQSDSAGTALTETGGSEKYTLGSGVSGAATIDTGSLKVEDYMFETGKGGIMRAGSLQRFADVLSRASAGDNRTITIAFIGGSATQGDGASSEDKSYVSLVEKWWEDTFPSTQFEFVNIGLTSQDSYLAVHRIKKEVLPKNPDLVFIETSLADGTSNSGEAFECLVRQLLLSDHEPAVVPVGLTDKGNSGAGTGYDSGSKQTTIAYKYNLAFLSMEKVVKMNVADSSWKWTDVGVSDINPNLNDAGHAFVAKLICEYTKRVMDGMSSSQYKPYEVPEPDAGAKLRYMDCNFYTITDFGSNVAAVDYYSVDLPDAKLNGFTKGWGTTNGGSGEFTISGSNIGIVWYRSIDGNGGQFDVSVDGTKLPFDFSASGISLDTTKSETETGVGVKELGKFDNKSHVISFTKNPASEGNAFYIIGFTVS